jgi:glycosyltransferase involved in cell wall biosynthesis
MRIAIDAHTLSGPPQGSRTYLENIVREMSILSPETEFVLLVDRPIVRHKSWGENIRVVEWSGSRVYRLTVGARHQMLQLRCSVFHCSYFLPIVPMPNPMVTIHDLLPETHPQLFTRKFALAARYGMRFSARQARHLFAPSEYVRQSLIDVYGVTPDRVSVTPNAVDFEFFQAGRSRDPSEIEATLRSGDYLLMVGRFDPRKDHATVVEAYVRLIARCSHLPQLVIAGSYGPTEIMIRSRIAALKLEHRILVLKNVPSHQLATLYAHALGTISASLGEGFGLPMLEAMAAGSPVICADNTAQTEVVKGCGLMFRTGSPENLADSIQSLLEDISLRGDLREKGLARARAYNWKQGAAEFLSQAQRLTLSAPRYQDTSNNR